MTTAKAAAKADKKSNVEAAMEIIEGLTLLEMSELVKALEELSPASVETWTRHVHPDDLAVAWQHLEKHFSGETDYYEAEFRMRVQVAPQGGQLGMESGDVGKGTAVGCVFQETVPSGE